MNHLVIEQDQSPIVDEHILRAVIAMNQRFTSGARFGDQGVEEWRNLRNLSGAVGVIWLEPQCLEERTVVEHGGDLGCGAAALAR